MRLTLPLSNNTIADNNSYTIANVIKRYLPPWISTHVKHHWPPTRAATNNILICLLVSRLITQSITWSILKVLFCRPEPKDIQFIVTSKHKTSRKSLSESMERTPRLQSFQWTCTDFALPCWTKGVNCLLWRTERRGRAERRQDKGADNAGVWIQQATYKNDQRDIQICRNLGWFQCCLATWRLALAKATFTKAPAC